MAVYYKFKSARDYESIPMDGPFISVGTLKEKIIESKHLGRGTDFDLVVTHAQSNEEYLDEAILIPKYTSVLIRRVPGLPRLPIVTEQEPKVENKVVETEPGKSTLPAGDISITKYPEDLDWDDFGDNLYAIPNELPVQSSNSVTEAPSTNKDDEDSKIKALIDTPALDWRRQGSDSFGPGRGCGRGVGGQGLERKTPPQGYVCHRCKVPGHFIQHCPTNGDPNYDIKRVRPPTGIPRSMLMANPDGSYALPSGVVAVLKPNEVAFEKEMEGLPSTHSSHSSSDLPPELLCPLCNDVMKDAALTSKCCFKSFCDKCIRGYIISKSSCVCGAKNILADYLVPNKTLRDTISRMVEGLNASAGSTIQVPDTDSAQCPQPKTPSPTSSAASKEEQKVSPANEETTKIEVAADDSKVVSVPQQKSEIVRATRAVDLSEAIHDSMSVKERAPQGNAQQVQEEVQQKLAPSEAGKKQKKKKVRLPIYDKQWKAPQDLGTEYYMMPMGPPSGYNSYWNRMQPGMEGFMPPYGAMQMMDYGLGPFDMTFGGVLPQDPFYMLRYMLPVVPPQRDLAEFSMGMNAPPPIMSKDEFEAPKANLRRKRERDFSKDREFGREVSSGGDVSSMKSKPKSIPPSSSTEYHRHRSERLSSCERNDQHQDRVHRPHRSKSSSRPSPEPLTKTSSTITVDRQLKTSDFSLINFPDEQVTKKRKLSRPSSTEAANAVRM